MNNQAGVKMDGLNKRMNGQTNARMWWMIKWRMSGLALHRVTPSNVWLVKAAKCDYAMTQLNSVILAICSSLLQPLMQRDTTLQTTQPVLLKAYPLFFFFWLSKTDYIQLTQNLQSNVRRRRTEADGGVVVVVWFTVGQTTSIWEHCSLLWRASRWLVERAESHVLPAADDARPRRHGEQLLADNRTTYARHSACF